MILMMIIIIIRIAMITAVVVNICHCYNYYYVISYSLIHHHLHEHHSLPFPLLSSFFPSFSFLMLPGDENRERHVVWKIGLQLMALRLLVCSPQRATITIATIHHKVSKGNIGCHGCNAELWCVVFMRAVVGYYGNAAFATSISRIRRWIVLCWLWVAITRLWMGFCFFFFLVTLCRFF